MADQTQEQKPIGVSALVPPELHARFDALCESQFRTKAATILMLIEQYCDHIESQLSQGG